MNSAYECRDTLIISGDVPAVNDNKNCYHIVTTLLHNGIRLQLHPDGISTAHYIGRKPALPSTDKRGIIKLCRRDLKQDILSACREFKPSFYINESLTPTRSTFMYAL